MVGVRMEPVENNRPATIKPVDLGQDGIPYVRQALAEGGPLGPLVAYLFDGQGASFAPMEEGTNLERALQFKTGTSMPTVAIRKWLADYMAARWGEQNVQLVFADPWRKPTGLNPKHSREPFFFGNQSIYFVPRGDNLYAKLSIGERQPLTWYFSVFVVAPPVLLALSGGHETQENLERLAQNTQAVLASAYDHEGYVVWEREAP
jgi:hypothetical protein